MVEFNFTLVHTFQRGQCDLVYIDLGKTQNIVGFTYMIT